MKKLLVLLLAIVGCLAIFIGVAKALTYFNAPDWIRYAVIPFALLLSYLASTAIVEEFAKRFKN
jgi:hypothetical protein